MRIFAILAVAGASVLGSGITSSAHAAICETVWTDGTILGVHTISQCIDLRQGPFCVVQGVGAYPQADVYFDLCLPAIVAAPSPAP